MSEQAGIPGEPIYEYAAVHAGGGVRRVGGSGDFRPDAATGRGGEVRRLLRRACQREGERDGQGRGLPPHTRRRSRQLNIHAEIMTEDGKKIALAADGVAIPAEGSPVFQLRENVTLTSNHPEYSWVNPIQVWAPGTVDMSKGEIRIKGYAV